MKRAIFAMVTLSMLAMLVAMSPDIRRYMRMRSM